MSRKLASSSSGWRPLPTRAKTITLIEPQCSLPPLTMIDLPSTVSEVPFGVDAKPAKVYDMSVYKAHLLSPSESVAYFTLLKEAVPIQGKEIEVEETYGSLEDDSAPMTLLDYCDIHSYAEFVRQMREIEEASDSSSDEDSAETEHVPFQSENHITTLRKGEVLVGGMPQRKTKGKSQRGRPKGRARTGAKKTHSTVLATFKIPLLSNHPLPPVWTGWIVFKRTYTATAASPYAYKPTQINNGWDPFVTGSGTTTPFMTFLRDNYNVFRVLAAGSLKEDTNLQSFPVTIRRRPTNVSMGSPGSQGEQMFNAPFGYQYTLPGTGSINHRTTSRYFDFKAITGNVYFRTQEAYAGTASSSPSDLITDNEQMDTNGAGNLTLGVLVTETLYLFLAASQMTADITA